jgi:hypothetical protein
VESCVRFQSTDTVPKGAYIVIAIQCIQLLLQRRNDRVKIIMLVYSVVMLCMVSAWFAVASASNEVDLIENPITGVVRASSCTPADITRELLFIMIVWAGDGLLVRIYPYARLG